MTNNKISDRLYGLLGVCYYQHFCPNCVKEITASKVAGTENRQPKSESANDNTSICWTTVQSFWLKNNSLNCFLGRIRKMRNYEYRRHGETSGRWSDQKLVQGIETATNRSDGRIFENNSWTSSDTNKYNNNFHKLIGC